MSHTPTLILFHGSAATGKTTIAKHVAKELMLPFFSRDAYKERLFELLEGEPTVEWSRKVGAVSFDMIYMTLEQVLAGGQSCVAETVWFQKFAGPVFTRFIEEYGCQIIQVHFFCDSAVRNERFAKRAVVDRHVAHMDSDRLHVMEELRKMDQTGQTLEIPCQMISVDTTDFSQVDVGSIVNQIREAMSS